MPQNFTVACQSARQAMQAAWDALNAAAHVARDARLEVRRREREAREAGNALRRASANEASANAVWDAHIMSITTDPTFGVEDLNAGTGEGTPGTAAAGPFDTRAGGTFGLWAQSEIPERLSEWLTRADQALQENARLAAVTLAAKAAKDAAEAENRAAQDALADASFALHNALRDRDRAEAAYEESQRLVETACAGQRSVSGNDPEISIDPGVLPEDEQRIRDRLESLPEAETDGLDEIEMTDDEGYEFTYTDPNTREEVTAVAAGTYSGGDVTFYGGTGAHLEMTLKHEVGHHVYRHLAQDQRDGWDQWYNTGSNRLRTPNGKMPTRYAGRNPNEGFAECYEKFHDAPHLLDPETRNKIRDILAALT